MGIQFFYYNILVSMYMHVIFIVNSVFLGRRISWYINDSLSMSLSLKPFNLSFFLFVDGLPVEFHTPLPSTIKLTLSSLQVAWNISLSIFASFLEALLSDNQPKGYVVSFHPQWPKLIFLNCMLISFKNALSQIYLTKSTFNCNPCTRVIKSKVILWCMWWGWIILNN